MNEILHRLILLKKIIGCLFHISLFKDFQLSDLLDQLQLVGPGSLFLTMLTSFFISLVFSLQIVKEFLYLNAIDLVGSVFALSFIRELSPVLTGIIIVGKVGSFFTSELATMKVTEQIDALFILGINPVSYLIIPRILSVILVLPLLNLFSLFTGLMSSSFICFLIYDVNPQIFFQSVFYRFLLLDLFKSSCKTLIFAFFIAIISCVWGITTRGGSKGVGVSTTSSVVTCLIIIFILDFFLSYLMFDNLISSFQFL
uniref:ABC transporter permease n=1 Tax=Osmundaria fimbriata TaxID=228265 RepID=A0A1Z1M400_OSMFI|nr:hypothetical protein [Osmundaria fimbriata]ARW60756.1 hypothetical protein [Osmundaria fimbriata]